jgi:hypothetical protein
MKLELANYLPNSTEQSLPWEVPNYSGGQEMRELNERSIQLLFLEIIDRPVFN